MIQCSDRLYRSLVQGDVEPRYRLRWYASDAGYLDLTDRLNENSFGTITRTIPWLMGGWQTSRATISLRNEDNYLSPHAPASVSGIATRSARKRQKTFVEVVAEFSVAGGTEELPVYAGYLSSMGVRPGVATMVVEDVTAVPFESDVGETVAVPPNETPGETIARLLDTYTALTSANRHAASFAHAAAVHESLDWRLWGAIAPNVKLGKAIDDIARSGLGTLHADETGLIKYDLEFPYGPWQGLVRRFPTVPLVIGSGVGDDWNHEERQSMFASEVVVRYQDAYVKRRDESREENGRVTKTLDCPYIAFGSRAQVAARIALEMTKDYYPFQEFSTGPVGLLIQLNDRVSVVDPMSDAQHAYRIIEKKWHPRMRTAFKATRDGHWDTILDGTPVQTGDFWSATELTL
jgi:hypothetical protein